ncbi:hypothetical protein Q7P36_010164 [Cladosporium allicinum]
MLVRIRMLHSWKSRSSIPSPLFFNHHNSTGSPTITQTTFSYLVCQFFVPAAARRGILDDLHGIRNAKPVPIVWSTFGSLLYGFEGLQFLETLHRSIEIQYCTYLRLIQSTYSGLGIRDVKAHTEEFTFEQPAHSFMLSQVHNFTGTSMFVIY